MTKGPGERREAPEAEVAEFVFKSSMVWRPSRT
jgi:hypothetical protein